MKIGITGSNGFIGSALSSVLKDHDVIPLCRTKDSAYYFDLLDDESFANIPKDLDVIVHAAYVTQGKDLGQSSQTNIEGSKKLFEFAKKNHIKIVFISSCSSHVDALSFYGKSKYELESLLDAEHDAIVRPGFVVGKGGVYKRLAESIRSLKVIPLFWGGRQTIQIIGIDDLCLSILVIIERDLKGFFNIVYEKSYAIKDFYSFVARSVGQKPYFIYLPGSLVLNLLKAAEKLKIPLPLTSENLLGLKALKPFQNDLDKLEIVPQSLESLTSTHFMSDKYN